MRLFGAQALTHEFFTFVALEVFGLGVGVAGLHLVLLRGLSVSRGIRFGTQTLAHEFFAFIALEVFGLGIGVAGLHLVLLRGGSFFVGCMCAAHGQSQTQSQKRDQLLHMVSCVKRWQQICRCENPPREMPAYNG